MHAMRRGTLSVLGLFILIVWSAPADAKEIWFSAEDVQKQIRHYFDISADNNRIRVAGESVVATPLVKQFYMNRNFLPVWTSTYGTLSRVTKFIAALEALEQEGLNPEEYHLRKIKKILSDRTDLKYQIQGHPNPTNDAVLDMLLTDAFITSAAHVAYGRVDPNLMGVRILTQRDQIDLITWLEKNLETESFSETYRKLTPQCADYARLRDKLAEFRELERRLKNLKISNEPALEKGMRDKKRIPALRVKLSALGDLAQASAVDDTLFNNEVEMAVMQFQLQHGIKVSGELDTQTLEMLNRPPDYYVEKIRINMERLRWRSYSWERQYIRVNIPAFTLDMIRDNETLLSMKVVVGTQYSRTPIFSDRLGFIILNPMWEMPPEIVLQEKISKIRNEPDYFTKNRVHVIEGWNEKAREIDPAFINWRTVPIQDIYGRYRFRMASGPGNPLGQVKFMFPNEYNVYLHDTSQRELFNQEIRNKSYGCIRLEKPVELAVLCLKGQRLWNQGRIRSALESGMEQKIRLTNPIPIHILYWTAWVDQAGKVHFREDIDGRDKKIKEVFHDIYFPLLNPALSN